MCSYAPFLQGFFKATQNVLQDAGTSLILSEVLDASTILGGTIDVPSIDDPFQIPSIPKFIGEHLSEWWDNELDTTRILEQFKSGPAREDVPAGFPPPPPNVEPEVISDGSSMPSLPGPPYKFVSPDLDHPPLRLAPKNFELYRLQKYNVFTDTLQQITVTPATGSEVEKEMQQRASREGELRNWRPFDVLDSWGKVLNRIWADPKNLAKTPGLWRKQRELFFPVESDLPILDSLGEPLAASAAGTLITLKPAACDVGGGAPTLFSIFLAEGGQIKVRSVIFDPRSGPVEFNDKITGEECHPTQESEIPVIPGCQTIQGCRRCIRYSGCFIGILPPDCVGNPVDVSAALPPARWQYCRELLRSPDFTREQRKAVGKSRVEWSTPRTRGRLAQRHVNCTDVCLLTSLTLHTRHLLTLSLLVGHSHHASELPVLRRMGSAGYNVCTVSRLLPYRHIRLGRFSGGSRFLGLGLTTSCVSV